MKTIIIGGACRTGKSRLANKIFTNTKSTVLHCDTLTNFLKNNVPEKFQVNFQSDGVSRQDPSEILVKKVIRHMGKEFDYLKIVESSVITPTTINQHFRSRHYISLFLGYPHVNSTRKLDEIRRAAVDDLYCWSHQFSDQKMLAYIEQFKQTSACIQRQCQQFNIPFIDTSDNWSEAIQAAYDFVIQQLAAV